jgi:hypothetical protein
MFIKYHQIISIPIQPFPPSRLAMHLLSMYSEGGQKIKVEPEVGDVDGMVDGRAISICRL